MQQKSTKKTKKEHKKQFKNNRASYLLNILCCSFTCKVIESDIQLVALILSILAEVFFFNSFLNFILVFLLFHFIYKQIFKRVLFLEKSVCSICETWLNLYKINWFCNRSLNDFEAFLSPIFSLFVNENISRSPIFVTHFNLFWLKTFNWSWVFMNIYQNYERLSTSS